MILASLSILSTNFLCFWGFLLDKKKTTEANLWSFFISWFMNITSCRPCRRHPLEAYHHQLEHLPDRQLKQLQLSATWLQ